MKENKVNTKVLKKEKYQIKTPKTIRIYDEYYFNDPEAIDLCAIIEKIPKNKKTELVFEVVEDSFVSEHNKNPVSITSFVVKILISSEQEILDTFFKNEYHPNKVKFHKNLGCDTASFVIEIDDRYEEIDTGADGYYGSHIAYKYNSSHFVEFYISSDMISEKEIRETLSYLFDIEEIKEV